MLEYKQKRNNGRTPFAGVYKFVCVCVCVFNTGFKSGDVHLLFVTPERMEPWLRKMSHAVLSKICLFAIDDVHLVAQW